LKKLNPPAGIEKGRHREYTHKGQKGSVTRPTSKVSSIKMDAEDLNEK
jgi:hypothetical protein